MTTLKIGEKAPDFKTADHEGKIRKLDDYLGKKLILFFYPRASTPGCTAEVCNLRDNFTVLKEKGYALLGVSGDTAKKQENFINKNSLPFPLLADVDKDVINAYKVWGPKKFMGREFDGIYRTTFVIDKNGIVENIITKVKTKDHAAQVLA